MRTAIFLALCLSLGVLWHCEQRNESTGALPELKSKQAQPNLVETIINKEEKLALQLVKEGADVEQTNKYGDTALIWAVNETFFDLSKALISKGANPNQKGTYGKTALHWASKQTDLRIANHLIKSGAKVNVMDENLNTPLMTAASADNLPMVELLLKNGAKLDASNEEGNTALMQAVTNRAGTVIETLVLKGASLDVENGLGENVLNMAAKWDLSNAFLTKPILKKYPNLSKKVSNSFVVVAANLEDKPQIDIQKFIKRIHELINNERRKQGLRALIYDANLGAVAYAHSEDMGNRKYFDHVNPEGENPTARAVRFKYKATSSSRQGARSGIGENIYMCKAYSGSHSHMTKGKKIVTYEWYTMEEIARNCVDGWMNSTGHRRNILTAHYEREGLGIAITKDDSIYITQNFF